MEFSSTVEQMKRVAMTAHLDHRFAWTLLLELASFIAQLAITDSIRQNLVYPTAQLDYININRALATGE